VASNFPTSLDNFTNPSSGNTLDSPSHSLQHSDINDAVEALEAKLGIGASPAGSATSGQVLTASTGGTTTWSTPTAGGLIQIVPSSVAVGSGSGSANANGFVTFTGVSSVSLNDVFSATYDSYRLVFFFNTPSTDLDINLRFRVSGADNSAGSYSRAIVESNSSAVTNRYFISQTSHEIMNCDGGTTSGYGGVIDLQNPFTSLATSGQIVSQGWDSAGGLRGRAGGLNFFTTTSFTGFSFLTTTGTISGAISVYGYRD
jgi:hypothetical protein